MTMIMMIVRYNFLIIYMPWLYIRFYILFNEYNVLITHEITEVKKTTWSYLAILYRHRQRRNQIELKIPAIKKKDTILSKLLSRVESMI